MFQGRNIEDCKELANMINLTANNQGAQMVEHHHGGVLKFNILLAIFSFPGHLSCTVQSLLRHLIVSGSTQTTVHQPVFQQGVLSDCTHILREVNIQNLEIGREWQCVQDRKGVLIESHTVLYSEMLKLSWFATEN